MPVSPYYFSVNGFVFPVVAVPPDASGGTRSMAVSPAQVVRQLLVTHGLGVMGPAEPWPMFATKEPFSPDNCITVYDTAWKDDGRSQIDGDSQGFFGIQVRVRSATHPIGYAKANAIKEEFLRGVALEDVIIGSNTYRVYSISKVGGVLVLGKADAQRSIFTINALASIRNIT